MTVFESYLPRKQLGKNLAWNSGAFLHGEVAGRQIEMEAGSGGNRP